VTARLTPARAAFVVHDQGPGFDVARLPDPTDPMFLERPSGRGVLLMRTFMDEVRYNATGNRVTLVKCRAAE
jgi:anti-sigma regulatory factor (Ser/Thr protein kinase)